mmetsp:Transcript_50997/g.159352  ORF Transcript_50997/g.159352 Transcript_50997/m.159352 type:complete len:135 (+) Transcript_50997:133-537(+)
MEKDKWTTLGESTDRIFSTSVESEWEYASDKAPFNECYERVKTAFIKNFAGPAKEGVPSPSAQLTQHQMCLGAIEACKPHITDIKIITPNLHYMPLSSLNVPAHMHATNNDVFFPIDGPSGYITSSASLNRSKL